MSVSMLITILSVLMKAINSQNGLVQLRLLITTNKTASGDLIGINFLAESDDINKVSS